MNSMKQKFQHSIRLQLFEDQITFNQLLCCNTAQ